VDLGARGIDAPLILHANMTLLEGILNNLIDNALRYGKPQDGQAARVTVEVVVTDGATGEKTLRLSVIDNGPGVPPAQRHSLTQRWVRGSTGQRLEQSAGLGAGLGLAIVGQYAHSLGASLDLGTGDDGHGLRASVTFQKV